MTEERELVLSLADKDYPGEDWSKVPHPEATPDVYRVVAWNRGGTLWRSCEFATEEEARRYAKKERGDDYVVVVVPGKAHEVKWKWFLARHKLGATTESASTTPSTGATSAGC